MPYLCQSFIDYTVTELLANLIIYLSQEFVIDNLKNITYLVLDFLPL